MFLALGFSNQDIETNKVFSFVLGIPPNVFFFELNTTKWAALLRLV